MHRLADEPFAGIVESFNIANEPSAGIVRFAFAVVPCAVFSPMEPSAGIVPVQGTLVVDLCEFWITWRTPMNFLQGSCLFVHAADGPSAGIVSSTNAICGTLLSGRASKMLFFFVQA